MVEPKLQHRPRMRYIAAGSDYEIRAPHPGQTLCAHRVLVLSGVNDCFAIKCKRCGHRWCNPALDKASVVALRGGKAQR